MITKAVFTLFFCIPFTVITETYGKGFSARCPSKLFSCTLHPSSSEGVVHGIRLFSERERRECDCEGHEVWTQSRRCSVHADTPVSGRGENPVRLRPDRELHRPCRDW